jgi:hypothetical protein
LWQNIQVLEEKEKMCYVSSAEQIGIEKGLQPGIHQGEARALQKLLAKRFGPLPTDIAASGFAARGRKLV